MNRTNEKPQQQQKIHKETITNNFVLRKAPSLNPVARAKKRETNLLSTMPAEAEDVDTVDC